MACTHRWVYADIAYDYRSDWLYQHSIFSNVYADILSNYSLPSHTAEEHRLFVCIIGQWFSAEELSYHISSEIVTEVMSSA